MILAAVFLSPKLPVPVIQASFAWVVDPWKGPRIPLAIGLAAYLGFSFRRANQPSQRMLLAAFFPFACLVVLASLGLFGELGTVSGSQKLVPLVFGLVTAVVAGKPIRLVSALGLVITAIVSYGLVRMRTLHDVTWMDQLARAHAGYGEPRVFGLVAGLGLVCAFTTILNSGTTKAVSLWSFATVICVAGLMASFSRGDVLSAAVIIIMIVACRGPLVRGQWIGVYLSAIGAFSGLVLFRAVRSGEPLMRDTDAVRRFADFGRAGRLVIHHPFSGLGPGGLLHRHSNVVNRVPTFNYTDAAAVGSSAMVMVVELGIAVLILWVLFGLGVSSRLKADTDPWMKAVGTALAFWGATFLFNTATSSRPGWFAFGCLVGALLLPVESKIPVPTESQHQPHQAEESVRITSA